MSSGFEQGEIHLLNFTWLRRDGIYKDTELFSENLSKSYLSRPELSAWDRKASGVSVALGSPCGVCLKGSESTVCWRPPPSQVSKGPGA